MLCIAASNDYFIGDYEDADDYYDDAPEVNSHPDLEVDVRIKRDVSGHMNVSLSWRSIDTASVYTVQWSRTGCIVEKCTVDTDVFASVLEDEAQTVRCCPLLCGGQHVLHTSYFELLW